MSLSAMHWARGIITGSSTTKQILVELANYEQGLGEVWPSISTLSAMTELDRKTVQTGLQELVRVGLLRDTGERKGRTKQIPVYQLVGFDPDHIRAQRGDLVRPHRKTPESGTVQKVGEGLENGPSQVSEGERESAAPVSANSPETGTVPETGSIPVSSWNDTGFTDKRSQNRDTERIYKSSEISDARAQAPRGARSRAEPEPERTKPTPAEVLERWRNRLAPIIASDVVLLLHGKGIAVSRNWPTWPEDLRGMFAERVEGVARGASDHELARGFCPPELKVEADVLAQRAAGELVEQYAQTQQAAA